MSTTGADLLVHALEDEGVRVVFGLPGVHNLPAWEALRRSSIRLVGVRHEQAAAYAADGYARATGEVGVALVTTGPGAANTLGAVGEAWASRSPVLTIATDIPTTLRRPGVVGGALHECADQPAMFAPVTKRVCSARTVDELAALTASACRSALEPPRRPVFLEVPTDLLSAPATAAGHAPYDPPPGLTRIPAAVVERIAAARRPLVWAGSGALEAGKEVGDLAQHLGAPIFTTYSARGLCAGHPLLVGLPPHLPAAGALWDAADLVIAVGSDLDGMCTMNWRLPQPPAMVMVNVDPADATKNYAGMVVEGDAGAGCAGLLQALDGASAAWADLDAIRASALEGLDAEHPAEMALVRAFARAVPAHAVVVADMCIAGYWLAALHAPAGPNLFQYPMGWGTLGYALPAAIGPAAAGVPTLAVCGDGGALFAIGELATLAQEQLPVTVVVFDDGGYGMLRYDQRHAGVETYGVDLQTPDFAAIAAAFGIRSEAFDFDGDRFAAAVAEHLADPAPTLLHVRATLTPPPTTSPRWYRSGPPTWA